ncbi:MAG: CopD family protein [Candidatus Magnetominusculus sp. LBB02]|nr:CopD family protein [Candidatus Magnetominusculus sp. LBB02]
MKGGNGALAGLILAVLMVLSPIVVSATPEYAEKTGLQCASCHENPAGGGSLTKEGNKFLQANGGMFRQPTRPQRVIRLIVGYLHLITAIAWFGTIIYVHLLLKPAYAAKGLPRGELALGWISITVIALTGTLLTVARISSFSAFYQSRFGVLLAIKIFLFVVMALTAAIVTFVIGPMLKKKKSSEAQSKKPEMTCEEVSRMDGSETSHAACIIYRDNIYDVTQSKLWKGGKHMNKHLAGGDLTDALKLAPHGEDKVVAMPFVGKLVHKTDATAAVRPVHERVFYIFAYMNLVLVFLITALVALWRWW